MKKRKEIDDMKLIRESTLKEDSLDQCRNDANSICKELDKANVWYDLVDYDMYPMNTSKVSFEVSGDWRHDHLAFKDAIYRWADKNNREIFKIDEKEIGESDSDDYVAQYDIFITDDKSSYSILNSMRGLFAEGLNQKEKQIYVKAVDEAEDVEDLEDICHEIYFYDKRLFARINKFPKDASFEDIKANILKNLQESLSESFSTDEIDKLESDIKDMKIGDSITVKNYKNGDIYKFVKRNDGNQISAFENVLGKNHMASPQQVFGWAKDSLIYADFKPKFSKDESLEEAAMPYVKWVKRADNGKWVMWGGSNSDKLDPDFLDQINHPNFLNKEYNIENQYIDAMILPAGEEPGKNECLTEAFGTHWINILNLDPEDLTDDDRNEYMNWLDDDKKDIFYAMKESDQELLVAEHKFNGWFWRVFDGDEKMIDKIRDLKQRVGTEDRVDIYDGLDEGATNTNNYAVEPHKIDMGVYDIVFRKDHPHAGERAHSKRFNSYDDALKFIKRNAKYNNWNASPINEDTIKTKDGKWTNKGKEGTHGKFNTKKEADAQRRAMFASGFHESLKESAAIDSAQKLEDDGWTVLSNGIRGGDMKHYWLARKMNKERGKADWKAIDDETGNVIDISYDQALGRELIGVSSNTSNLSNKLGKMLLPKNEELKESYYKLCWYDSDPETGFYGDKFDCYAVVKAFDAKDAQEKFKDLLLRTGDEQDRDRIRYFRNFTDYLRDSEMYIDDATEEEYNEYKDYQEARFESLKESTSPFLTKQEFKAINDYVTHHLFTGYRYGSVDSATILDSNGSYKLVSADISYRTEDGEYEYVTEKFKLFADGSVEVIADESLKEDFSSFDLINYNDFLANNFDGWSNDIDYLIKDLNKVAKALGTSAQKLVFYIDYDEEFWAADSIADVTLYLGQDYSVYKVKSSDVKFAALVPDNVWIFKNEKEANSVINDVKAFANDMDESFSRWGKFSEGLVDITDDFRFAREKWNELYPDVDFDLALERWNKESNIADPDWFAKPIYSVKAWEDMVQMFAPDIESTSEESSDEIDED